MPDTSRRVLSAQTAPHQDLSRRVGRALQYPLRKPVAEHTRIAFEQADAWRCRHLESPLIIDAGCGVGLSTRHLARRFPDNIVIGIDRSADRLSRDHGELPANALLVRADLIDFWRLALAGGWQPQRHYLLYPNPYPKPGHFKMRWPGHPVFPAIAALGGQLELRSNWKIYVQEFALALYQVAGIEVDVEEYQPENDFLTPFEAKYHRSGQPLWRLVATLPYRPGLLPIDR
ncbi:tRNA (guanine(46)-N(7))-methyltransferase TrmB [Halomonas halocynthiae]|uniref:tRNA (guanine(46)-N(7))-methyltransferase TrmB n=1 Tax=Halomonas halocynthiae TaxID=176290 RepID=UPI0004869278|nr:SAM-dependent methyltransferase [Halomonas halocynthiae]